VGLGSSAGDGPNSLAVADLHGDGRADVVIGRASGTDRYAAVLKTDPPARCGLDFVGPRLGQPTFQASRAEIRDINGDGKPDAIWLGTGGFTTGFTFTFGDGAGGFEGAGQGYAVTEGEPIRDAAFGDLDGDGLLDAVVVTDPQKPPFVLYRDPAAPGGWSEASPFHPEALATGHWNAPFNLTIADFDYDGHQDVAYGGPDALWLHFGRGDGGYDWHKVSVGAPVYGVSAHDLNRDGLLDFAFSADGDHACTALTSPSGAWPTTYASCHQVNAIVSRVHLVDLDGDDVVEMVFLDRDGDSYSPIDTVHVRRQGTPDSGIFDLGQAVPVCSGAGDVAFADIDLDGLIDLVVSCGGGGDGGGGGGEAHAEIHLQTANGGFAGMSLMGQPSNAPGIAAGDVDGDHQPDVLLGQASIPSVTRSPGRLDDAAPLAIAAEEQWVNEVALVDFDGDGLLDVVAVAGDDVIITLATGPGALGPHQTTTLPSWLSSFAVGDMNADGRADLVTTAYSANGYIVSVFGQKSEPGTLDTVPWTTTTVGTTFPSRVDIVSVWPRPRRDLLLHRSNGFDLLLQGDQGQLLRYPSDPEAPVSQIGGIGVGYFGWNPGYHEVVMGSRCAGQPAAPCLTLWRLALCQSIEAVCFAPHTQLGLEMPEADIDDIAVADLNGDGLDDVVLLRTVHFSTLSAHVYEVRLQDPVKPGSFLAPTYISGGAGAGLRVHLADLDGDGALDIVGVARGPHHPMILVLRRDSEGGDVAFHPPEPKLVPLMHPWDARVTVGDFNRDGVPDLVVHEAYSRTIRTLLGR